MDSKVFASVRKTRVVGSDHERMRHTVTLELHSLAGQDPYFCATLHSERRAANRWVDDGGGADHEAIARLWPSLAGVLRWHLVSTKAPMHYVANSQYWAGLDKQWCQGKPNDPPNRGHFDSTSLWGTVPGDAERVHPMDDPDMTRERLAEILNERLAALQAAFRADMESIFPPEQVAAAFAFQEAA